MGAEMAGGEEVRVWRKAIPEGRDRMQSRVLVWVVGCLLIWMTFEVLRSDYLIWDIAFLRPFALISIAVSVAFAVLVRALRAATTTASLFGGMICLTLIDGTAPRFDSQVLSGVTPLVMLFLLTFLSTRVGRRKKAAAGLAEGRKGRSAAQVIANLSISALCVSYLVLFNFDGYRTLLRVGPSRAMAISGHDDDVSGCAGRGHGGYGIFGDWAGFWRAACDGFEFEAR